MGLLDKVALRFNESFWPQKHILAFIGQSDRQWPDVFNLEHSCGQPVLVAFKSGRAARADEQRDDSELVAGLMQQLNSAFRARVRRARGLARHALGQRSARAGIVFLCPRRQHASRPRHAGPAARRSRLLCRRSHRARPLVDRARSLSVGPARSAPRAGKLSVCCHTFTPRDKPAVAPSGSAQSILQEKANAPRRVRA